MALRTPPYASLLVSVNGGSPTSGLIYVPASATIQLSAATTLAITQWLWEIYDYPVGMALPTGWSWQSGTNTVMQFAGGFSPPSFSTGTIWGPFCLRLRVNGSPTQYDSTGALNEGFDPDLVDEASILKLLSPNGIEGIGFNESTQGDAIRSSAGATMRTLRTVDTALTAATGAGLTYTTYASPDANSAPDATYWVFSAINITGTLTAQRTLTFTVSPGATATKLLINSTTFPIVAATSVGASKVTIPPATGMWVYYDGSTGLTPTGAGGLTSVTYATPDSNNSVPAGYWAFATINVTGTLTAQRTLTFTVTSGVVATKLIVNSTTYPIVAATSVGAKTVSIPPGTASWVYFDGTNGLVAAAVAGGTVTVTSFGAIGDSNGTSGNGTDNQSFFNTAVNSGAGTVVVPKGTGTGSYRIGSDLTVPANVTLRFETDPTVAALIVDNGVTVTINGPIDARKTAKLFGPDATPWVWPSADLATTYVPPMRWKNNRAYKTGDMVLPLAALTGFLYMVQNGGTSAALVGSEPTWPVTLGATAVDNGVTWVCLKTSAAFTGVVTVGHNEPSPCWWGADISSATDSSAAYQRMLDAIALVNVGTAIRIPAGGIKTSLPLIHYTANCGQLGDSFGGTTFTVNHKSYFMALLPDASFPGMPTVETPFFGGSTPTSYAFVLNTQGTAQPNNERLLFDLTCPNVDMLTYGPLLVTAATTATPIVVTSPGHGLGSAVSPPITGATNATPIVITQTGHGYTTGQTVTTSGILGNTAANTTTTVTVTGSNTYRLDGTTGNGTYVQSYYINGAWTGGTSSVQVTIAGSAGLSGLNGSFPILVNSADTFTLLGSSGSGSYTGGGTICKTAYGSVGLPNPCTQIDYAGFVKRSAAADTILFIGVTSAGIRFAEDPDAISFGLNYSNLAGVNCYTSCFLSTTGKPNGPGTLNPAMNVLDSDWFAALPGDSIAIIGATLTGTTVCTFTTSSSLAASGFAENSLVTTFNVGGITGLPSTGLAMHVIDDHTFSVTTTGLGGAYTSGGSAMAQWRVGQLYEYRYSWDGASGQLALFVGVAGGTLQRVKLISGVTGTYKRATYETLVFGSTVGTFPATGVRYGVMPGTYDSFRLRVSDGTNSGMLNASCPEPMTFGATSLAHSSKMSNADSSTYHCNVVVQSNCDRFYRGLIGVYGTSQGYIYTTGQIVSGDSGGQSGQDLKNFTYIGAHSGIFIGPNTTITLEKLVSGGCRNAVLCADGPIYNMDVTRCQFKLGGSFARHAFLMTEGSGPNTFANCTSLGGLYPWWFCGVAANFSKIYLISGGHVLMGFIGAGYGAVTLDHCNIDDEGGVSPFQLEYGVAASAMQIFKLVNNVIVMLTIPGVSYPIFLEGGLGDNVDLGQLLVDGSVSMPAAVKVSSHLLAEPVTLGDPIVMQNMAPNTPTFQKYVSALCLPLEAMGRVALAVVGAGPAVLTPSQDTCFNRKIVVTGSPSSPTTLLLANVPQWTRIIKNEQTGGTTLIVGANNGNTTTPGAVGSTIRIAPGATLTDVNIDASGNVTSASANIAVRSTVTVTGAQALPGGSYEFPFDASGAPFAITTNAFAQVGDRYLMKNQAATSRNAMTVTDPQGFQMQDPEAPSGTPLVPGATGVALQDPGAWYWWELMLRTTDSVTYWSVKKA